MECFYYIHENLYKMYFKKHTNLKNWFDYFWAFYYLGNKEKSVLENTIYNKYKMADDWLKKGKIDDVFFIFDGENYLFRPDLFSLIFNKVHNQFLQLGDSEELKQILYRLINCPEMLEYSFVFKEETKSKLNMLFSSYDTTTFFTVLLIFAQTNQIILPGHSITNKKMAEVYNKTTITESFCEFVEDAVELNMMQISVPSLIEKYRDFYKSGNYNALINLLEEGCKINFIFSAYEDELQIQNSVYCCKNDFPLFGDVIKDSISFAKKLKAKYPEQIRIKTTVYPISYSLMIIKKKRSSSIAKVDLYLIKGEADTRHSFIFRSDENMEGYSLYRNNFFDIFNDAGSVEL